MAIYTIDDLNKLIVEINEDVIKEVSAKALVLLEKHLMDDVYKYDYYPNKVYEDGTGKPTFQFQKAFAFKEISKVLNTVSSTLFYDYETMDSPSPEHPTRHGNYKKGRDNREQLAEMLNKRAIVGGKMRNLYWDNFINELSQNIDEWFYSEYSKKGITLRRK